MSAAPLDLLASASACVSAGLAVLVLIPGRSYATRRLDRLRLPPVGRALGGGWIGGGGRDRTGERSDRGHGSEPVVSLSAVAKARASPGRANLADPRARRAVAGFAAVAAALLWGGWAGLLVGGVAGVVVDGVLARAEPAAVRERRARLHADLPLAADLLSACLRAGSPPERAVDAVARALGGPLGAELALVAAALRLGADGPTAWSGFASDPMLGSFGRAMARAWESGAPLAQSLDRIAADSRQSRRAAAEERARAVGVKAAAPLGLCFLPAFLLLGVVPVVVGAVSRLLG